MLRDLPGGACSVLGASSGEAAVAAAAAAAGAAAVEVSAGLSSAGLVASGSVLPDFLDFFLKAALSLAFRLSRAPRAVKKRTGLVSYPAHWLQMVTIDRMQMVRHEKP